MTLSDQMDLISPADDVWSVTRLTTTVKRMIEGEIPAIWVRGEVAGCRTYPSGHCYFTLRDSMCQVRCCLWKRDMSKAGKPPADGTDVYVLVRPGFYEVKGEFQLNVQRILPSSAVGRAQQEFERVKALLHKDGLFDPARKRPMPALAGTLAVVTSTAGAALRDVITVARRRWPSARVLVVNARVQGDGAVEALVRALRLVNRLPGVDVCIVGRGGGDREDLTAFNAEAVCRALAEVRVPTISAVGHETDISLTDLVADLRAPTPSAAAELALPDQRAVRRA
ncbi:MAG: exodeoxyribonuclease VII large subunit, partial [Gemmatimonadales bacterium]